MYSVLLVDDEVYARKGLRGLIPWQQYGFEITAEAENGEEALRLIESLQPDLVITDIRMPVLDGLQLIRTVQERELGDPKFIIISGYNDFKYAQQAVRFGVEDFILKPIDEMELTDTLSRVAETLDRENLLDAEHPAVHLSMLESLLTGRLEGQYAAGAASALGLSPDRSLCYLITEVNDYAAASDEHGENGLLERWKGKVAEAASALMPGTEPLLHDHGGWVIGIVLSEGDGDSASGEDWEAAANRLLRSLKAPGDGNLRIYVGETADSPRNLHRSYLTAVRAMDYKYALEDSSILTPARIAGIQLSNTEPAQELYDKLLHALEEHDLDSSARVLDELFELFKRLCFAPDAVTASLTRAVQAVTRTVKTMDGSEQSLHSLVAMNNLRTAPKTLAGMRNLMDAFVAEASQYMAELRKEKTKGSIHKIKQYIEGHYRENISLKVIARQYYMNPVYLGQLFKKTYGVYFNDFLLELRIQEAKRLLRQTDMRIYEIAAQVGFNNPDYFVTQFEKVEQKTPTEYRNALVSKE